MRPTSVPSIRCAFQKWLVPYLGDKPLTAVHNGSVKHLVSAMAAQGLSPKTISTYTNLVKTIVASFVDEESGEPLYPRTWRNDILDTPVVDPRKQKTPCLEVAEIEKMVAESKGQERMLYILLASSGLRISECLALQRKHIVRLQAGDFRTLDIVCQVSRDAEIVNYGKTGAAIRQVDLHPSVAQELKVYVLNREANGLVSGRGKASFRFSSAAGLLFPTRVGTPNLPRNLLRVLQKRTGKAFHSFRRYRETWLSEMNCNTDVKNWWMGHTVKDMSGLYSKLSRKVEMRLAEAERVGIGFRLRNQIVKAS